MSLTILIAEWWKKLFKKNNKKNTDEELERSEKFNKIKRKIDEVIEIQFNGGWRLTEEEQKIQDEFLPKLFKKMTEKRELPEKPQITTLVPRNETEAVEMLKKINKKFPETIRNFMKSNSEVREQDEEINKIYKEIKEMYSEIQEMCREIKETNEKNKKLETKKSKDFKTAQDFKNELKEIELGERDEFSAKLIGSIKRILANPRVKSETKQVLSGMINKALDNSKLKPKAKSKLLEIQKT